MNEAIPNKGTILIVEDDLGLLHLTQKKVRQMGFETEVVSRGSEAISIITAKEPLLILLDYQLADMTCENVLEKLGEKGQLPPFIIMTGHGNEKIAVEMMKLGAIDYMVKDNAFLDALPSVVMRAVNHVTVKNALRHSEEMYRSLLENINVGVTLISPKLEVLALNKKMKEWFPLIDERKKPICFHALRNPPRDKACSDCPTLLAFKDGNTYETTCKTMVSGCEKYLRIVATPIRDKDGKVIQVIEQAEDHTEKSFAQIEKENLEAQLRQSHKMEAIGTLAGGVAHDFNNILAVILGYADMAMDDIPDDNPAKNQIAIVLKAANRAKELIKHILSFCRKEVTGRSPLALHLMVKEALELLRSTIPTTIEISQNIDPSCGNILAEPSQIHQLLMNLCTNAAQSMDQNGGTLKVQLRPVKLSIEDLKNKPDLKPGRYAHLSVKDNGTGISPEYIDKIFDPYFTTKEVGKGSGMGLAIVIGIIHSHDGMITVESTPGEGTTFNVYFPLIDEEDLAELENADPLPTGNEKILVIDDEQGIVELTKKRLERLGYQVTAMTSSLEALELFRSDPNHFDLIISDQTMPKLSGADLAKKLMEIRTDLPIIICSGYSSKMDADKASYMGIKAFIMKPVDNRELANTIRSILDENKKIS